MGLGRMMSRVVRGALGLIVAGAILVPMALIGAGIAVPVLVVLALGGIIGAATLFAVGIPVLIVGLIAAAIIASVFGLAGGVVGIGILVAKVMLVAALASWIFRKLFVRRPPAEPVLVGRPVVDVAAPIRDRFDVAAEKELERELGF